MRIIVGACIVVIMASVTVIALKLGTQNRDQGTIAAPQNTPAATPASPDATDHASPSPDGSIAAPKVTEPTGPPPLPQDPADLGVLVNKDHGLDPKGYVPKRLMTMNGEQIRSDAGGALKRLFKAARREGYDLRLVSGYRSAARQKVLHQSYVDRSGTDSAATFSAKAGFSEHQTGLAADVAGNKCELKACFGNTAAGRWVAQHAHQYGFIIRYPKGRDKVTGYTYEPWHLRYLGKDLTQEYRASRSTTLEEYYGKD